MKISKSKLKELIKERREMVKPIRVEFYKRYHSPMPHKEIEMEAVPGITLDQIVDNVGKVMDRDYYDLAQIYFMNKLWGHVYYKGDKPTFKKGRIKLPKDIKEEYGKKMGAPKLTVSRFPKGVLFQLQPDSNIPKWVGLATVSVNGLVNFRKPKSSINPIYMRKIREAERAANRGELEKMYPMPSTKTGWDLEREED